MGQDCTEGCKKLFLDGSKSSTKKREEKGPADHPGELLAGPLKNYHTGYLADPNGIRDTPLVPKGTVADIYIYICMYTNKWF